MKNSSDKTALQEKALDSIRDWSKWLIGLNFTSGGGCIAILQTGATAAMKFYLVGAVFFFGLSAAVSALILANLPMIMQRLPLQTKKGEKREIHDYWILFPGLSLQLLTILQLLLFVTGLAFLFTWMLLKPVPAK